MRQKKKRKILAVLLGGALLGAQIPEPTACMHVCSEERGCVTKAEQTEVYDKV